MTQLKTSVRRLVEFLLRSGDLDNRKSTKADAMTEGSRIHRMIQRRMGANYHAEVGLRYVMPTPDYELIIDGRADGILIEPLKEYTGKELAGILSENSLSEERFPAIGSLPEQDAETLLSKEPMRPAKTQSAQSVEHVAVTIDEIKGTYRDLAKMKEAEPVHLAQAKCYAYMFAYEKHLPQIRVRMTYCQIETEEIRYFHFDYTYDELSVWFAALIAEYRKWADFEFQWKQKRQASLRKLSFPFAYRKGQKELVTYVYQTIYHQRKLFIEAPTGVGKTIATVFPALKAMGENMSERIFYLTAKTMTRQVAEQALFILRKQELFLKSITLTAKDKICFLEESDCNPVSCSYAKGHFDRVNAALYDILTNQDNFDRETILQYSVKYQVCPFELSLDLAMFSDLVVCDYNYLFDPHAYLRRFFTEGVREDYTFLIDEAHNLVERGRKMYSAELKKEELLRLKRLMGKESIKITHAFESCNKEMLALKRTCEQYEVLSEEAIAPLVRRLLRLSSLLEDYLDEHEEGPVRKELLLFYFDLSHFLLIHENLDADYVIYTEHNEDNEFLLKLFNVNPARNLRDCMGRGRASILFSATFLPIDYYKALLGASEGDYEVYAESVFNPDKRGLYIANDVTSKYTRRGYEEYFKIASYIHKVVEARSGNYLVFFPSFAFLREVSEIYAEEYGSDGLLIQTPTMREADREAFLSHFTKTDTSEEDGAPEADGDLVNVGSKQSASGAGGAPVEWKTRRTVLGLCVLGGIFSEGIDLRADCLIGVIVVGTGIPMVCNEREILKKYFDRNGQSGYDYAYKYPGMNKVLQAAGRVIRTADDVGVVALLDERFTQRGYLRLFPREWGNYQVVSAGQIGSRMERFWEEWV